MLSSRNELEAARCVSYSYVFAASVFRSPFPSYEDVVALKDSDYCNLNVITSLVSLGIARRREIKHGFIYKSGAPEALEPEGPRKDCIYM